jgi:hypothetical protein
MGGKFDGLIALRVEVLSSVFNVTSKCKLRRPVIA